MLYWLVNFKHGNWAGSINISIQINLNNIFQIFGLIKSFYNEEFIA